MITSWGEVLFEKVSNKGRKEKEPKERSKTELISATVPLRPVKIRKRARPHREKRDFDQEE